jgi:hypothetical protein
LVLTKATKPLTRTALRSSTPKSWSFKRPKAQYHRDAKSTNAQALHARASIVFYNMSLTSSTLSSAVEVTSEFNKLLQQRNASPVSGKVSLEAIEGFVKEAYRIVRHSAGLQVVLSSDADWLIG